MTFDSRESSRADGRPFSLYEFRFGPETGNVARYTSLASGLTVGADTYAPLAITHGEIVASGTFDKTVLPVEMPEDGVIPSLFRGGQPSSPVTLTIRQGHVSDTDYKVCWVGVVHTGTFENGKFNLECEPISSSLRRVMLTRDYQLSCPLVLFGPKCRASREAATVTAVVTTVDGPFVTLPSTWAETDRKDRFIGGIAQWLAEDGRTERRTIVSRAGDVLTLGSSARGLSATDTITLIRGCNHQQDGCRDHGNILNYGGQPAIPLENPTGIHNAYY